MKELVSTGLKIGIFIGLIFGILVVGLPTQKASATDNQKWFVCKYVGTPGVDERLQSGNNPISVGNGGVPQPVPVGQFFNDSQGRSYILAEDIGQPEPDPSECPPPNGGPSPTPVPPTPTPVVTPSPTPTPTVTPSPTPSNSPSPTPSATPSPTPPPDIGAFSIATCPAGVPVPVGQSAISIRGSVLLILLLHVRVDGNLITLQDALGDGSVGDAFVTPGVHEITISNQADDAVLFAETVDCPDCNPATPPPPPAPTPTPVHTLPPTDTE